MPDHLEENRREVQQFIENRIAQVMDNYLFEPIDERTLVNMKSSLCSILQEFSPLPEPDVQVTQDSQDPTLLRISIDLPIFTSTINLDRNPTPIRELWQNIPTANNEIEEEFFSRGDNR